MGILDRVNSSADIKKLNENELAPLCAEIRQLIIQDVSKTGGHLASNLGAVELTVALHRVYDTSADRLVLDVGHQCYTHKIITGRATALSTVRQLGGISGFPKPYESNDDAFVAGHASTSVSVGLGMARARTQTGGDYSVVAVIGDGAMTGGLAYEGLSDLADSNERMVVVLNDNNMSISENVGGVAKLLQALRIKPGYISFKRWYRSTFKKLPFLYNFNHRIKEWLKSWLLPGNIFNELGLEYIGPIDGHDVRKLELVFEMAKETDSPVLVHVLTKKGKGCKYAEEHPDKYHGVGPFDPVSGELLSAGAGFSDMFGHDLCDFAQADDRIVAVTAAMSGGTGLECFAKKYPDRFFDIGIAEGHATAMAAGMAKQGLLPVFAVYSSFLQRGFDMLIHDVSLLRMHVVFGVDRAGLVGSDGETHNGVFDVSYLCTVPGMTVLCPASYQELRDMLEYAIHRIDGPVAVRYPRGGEGEYAQSHLEAETLLREGEDVTLVCYGIMVNEALAAADRLGQSGISAEIIKLAEIAPADFTVAMGSIKKTGHVIIAEDACAQGCVGERLLSACVQSGVPVASARLLNLGDGIVEHGSVTELMSLRGIDAAGIVSAARAMRADRMR